jgi:hypothetical protein
MLETANGLLTLVSDTTDPDQIANPYKYGGTVVEGGAEGKGFW